MLLDLEGRVLAVEGAGFRSLHGQVLARQGGPEGGGDDRVRLQRIEGASERGGIASQPAPRALALGEGVGIDQRGLPRIELPLEPVETRRQQSAQGQERVAGGIAGLELDVGGLHLETTAARR